MVLLIIRLHQIGELSGHSFRVGAALDLLNKNIPFEQIMLRRRLEIRN